jgi:Skp family chaperone for outer membrane proteins
MKSLITTAVLTLIIVFSANAQKTSSALSPILGLYYNVKDALVNSDAKVVSAKAGDLIKTINSIDLKTLSTAEQSAFGSLKDKLVSDANNISENNDIGKQKAYFSFVSTNIYSLAKLVRLSDQPVYQQYCPMKKAYWLSNEAAIKNPYYGKQMLSCGKVSDILK